MKSNPFLGGFLLLIASGAWAATDNWSDSVVAALTQKNREALERLLSKGSQGNDPVSAFANVAIGLRGKPEADRCLLQFSRAFEDPIVSGFGDESFNAYGGTVVDTTVPAKAREFLLRTMVLTSRKLSPAYQDSLLPVMSRLLNGPESSKDLQVLALQCLGRVPTGKGSSVFRDFLISSDPALRTAAYQGLGSKVHANRVSNHRDGNAEIFEDLVRLSADGIDLAQVKVLALMGEDYSRSYLLSKCAGDAEKIRTAFAFDSGVDHLPLIKEAVRLMQVGGQEPTLGKAVIQGVGEPQEVIGGLLAGADTDMLRGLQLLKLFPAHIPRHGPAIRAYEGSQNQAVRQAAVALIPFLPTYSERAE